MIRHRVDDDWCIAFRGVMLPRIEARKSCWSFDLEG